MKLFIDTSVFLSFYSNPTVEPPRKLKQLTVLAESGKVNLLLPRQVIDETHRRRAEIISDSFFKKAKGAKLSLWVPEYCTQHEQYSSMQDYRKKLEQIHRRIVLDLRKDIENRKLPADLLLQKLFNLASRVDDMSVIESARQRIDLGNPPGQKNSLGDAVIWESLLFGVQYGEDILFVSKDAGFCSPLDEDNFNEFLLQEWTYKKRSRLRFYRDLTEFFKKEFPEIELQPEADWEKAFFIQNLAQSPDFATTHFLIAKLSSYGSFFTKKQVEDMVDALFTNNQIGWIIGDSDIKKFYQNLYDYHLSSLPPDKERKLRIILTGIILEDVDDLPF